MKKRPKDVRVAELRDKLAVKEAYIQRLLAKIDALKEQIAKLEENEKPLPPVVEPQVLPVQPEPPVQAPVPQEPTVPPPSEGTP